MDKLSSNSSSILRALFPRTATLLTHLLSSMGAKVGAPFEYVESDIAEALICTLQLAYVGERKGFAWATKLAQALSEPV